MVPLMRKTDGVPHNQYLMQKGRTWYVRVAVPPSLRQRLGKQHVVKSLRTRDAAEARRRRDQAVAAIKGSFLSLQGADIWDPVEMGLEWRAKYQAASAVHEDQDDPDCRSEREDVRWDIVDDVEDLRQAGRPEAAKKLYRIATTEDAVLSEAFDKWLDEVKGIHRPQTILGHRQAWGLFQGENPEVILAADLDRRKAGRFVTEVLRKGRAPATANRLLTSLSSFWRWMIKLGWTENNPWVGQSVSVRAGPQERRERPYSAAELVALLEADAVAIMGKTYGPAIRDLLRLGLMTGCRLNELCGLGTGHVLAADRAIRIATGKTANARRVVPVHEIVWPIVERRLASAADDVLFPELKPKGPDGKRSWYVSKRFTEFRREVLGTDNTVDFHSLRRTFATYLEHAMATSLAVNAQVVAQLMGHEKGSLAFSTYSGGMRLQHLREAVEAMSKVIEVEVMAALAGSPMPVGQALAREASLEAGTLV